MEKPQFDVQETKEQAVGFFKKHKGKLIAGAAGLGLTILGGIGLAKLAGRDKEAGFYCEADSDFGVENIETVSEASAADED